MGVGDNMGWQWGRLGRVGAMGGLRRIATGELEWTSVTMGEALCRLSSMIVKELEWTRIALCEGSAKEDHVGYCDTF